MPDSKTPASTPEGSFDADFRGVHYDFLKDRIPDWFTQASTWRQTVMSAHDLQLPAWYLKATAGQKKTLADTHKRYRGTLNEVDTRLGGIKGIFEFAEQPLKEAIKAKFKLDLDVRNTYFARKYGFKGRDDFFGFFVFDQEPDQSLRYEYRGTSLLEAALANFTPEEAKPQRCNNCQIITAWNSYDGDVLPTFEAINSQAIAIAPHEFAELCRTLDLGAQYQKHIKDILEPKTDSERKALEQALDEHQQQQLAVTTETAHQQSVISASAYKALQQVIGKQSRITLDGQPVVHSTLKIFGIDLVGPLLIGPDRASADQTRRMVAYLPNDPQQPLKEYASRGEFMAELRSRLHNADFRRYFSQFVPMRQQGVFVSELSKRYNTTSVDTQADYPLQADPARLPMEETLIEGDLWQQLRQDSISKTCNDARVVAVPTEDEDREARAQRLQSYLDAANSVLNLAAFVVPGLGPIMMTIGAAQMCDDVFEGIEAFEQGEIKEMWAHLASVALNIGFVGTGAAVLPKVQLSSVVDTLKPVTLANGQQKLWNPDISSYRSSATLAPESEADEWGLHTHEGQRLLRVEGDHYEVEQDPTTERFRIKHPTRPDAYSPELVHNRQGAWHHEGENPQTWDGPKLMRRLGPLAEGFSDAELEHIRQTSGIDNDVLRRMHAQGESIPAILLETLKKFRAYADAVKISQGSAKGQLSGYIAPLAVELPGWPKNKAIEVFTEDDLAGPSIRYGNQDAATKDVLKVTRQDLLEGRVPERIVAFLSEAEIKALLPNYTPRTPAERAGAVQQQLQAHAVRERLRLTQSLYAEQQKSSDPAVAVVQRDFNGLPTSMVRELLADATPAERLRLETEKRVPLRIAEGARRL
ncbi:dermonecrotic toxin domain-containing protein [Pseudomonas sp. SDO55104_S430]